jgi:hypothetical protein
MRHYSRAAREMSRLNGTCFLWLQDQELSDF